MCYAGVDNLNAVRRAAPSGRGSLTLPVPISQAPLTSHLMVINLLLGLRGPAAELLFRDDQARASDKFGGDEADIPAEIGKGCDTWVLPTADFDTCIGSKAGTGLRLGQETITQLNVLKHFWIFR